MFDKILANRMEQNQMNTLEFAKKGFEIQKGWCLEEAHSFNKRIPPTFYYYLI